MAVPASAQLNVGDLALDPQLTRNPIEEQATERNNITLNFAPGSSSGVANATRTAARWERVIPQGLPSHRANIRARSCGSSAAYVGTIDDILVFTGNTNIDGPGGILAQSGPCSIRSSNGLTAYNTLVFDTADLKQFSGQLADIAVHELGHSLGIGTLWQRFGLVRPQPDLPGQQRPVQIPRGGRLPRSQRESSCHQETVLVTERDWHSSAGEEERPHGRLFMTTVCSRRERANFSGQGVDELLELGEREQLITPSYRSE